eukprot:gene30958-12132_t
MHHGKSTNRVRLPHVWSLLVAGIALFALVHLYMSIADLSGHDKLPDTGALPPSPPPVPFEVPDVIVFELTPPVDPTTYIVDPVSDLMRQSRQLVDSHIQSEAFKARVKRIHVR